MPPRGIRPAETLIANIGGSRDLNVPERDTRAIALVLTQETFWAREPAKHGSERQRLRGSF